jgi:hypothetical protein
MLREDTELNATRLLSGFIPCGSTNYYIGPITPLQALKVNQAYAQFIEDSKFTQVLTVNSIKVYLVEYNLWSEQEEKELEEIPSAIEAAKISLYETYAGHRNTAAARERVNKLKSRYNMLLVKRHAYDNYTLEGLGGYIKAQYLVGYASRDINGESVWRGTEFLHDTSGLHDTLLAEYQAAMFSEADIRETAKSDLWRSYWNVSHEAILCQPGYILSDEQRYVVNWSKIYDSVYDSPERPDQEVISDDDLLDGWLLVQRKKTEENASPADETRFAGAGEVFVVADSDADAARINKLNTGTAKLIQKQRLDLIKQRGQVNETEFQDSRLQMMEKAREQFKARVSGGGK